MLGGSCSPCCSQPCQCGTEGPYESQTGIESSAGRWCCSGIRPSEITVRMTAQASQTTFYSYQTTPGPWFAGYFYDTARDRYYQKRYKRTLTLDVSSLNADYVLTAQNIYWGNQTALVCGYAYGPFAFPRIFPGYEPGGVTINGLVYRVIVDDQPFPSYTITFQTGNSGVLAHQAAGTIRREYERRDMRYIGFFQFEPDGDWIRDESLDTEPSPVSCTYRWSMTSRSVFNEPACDLRGLGVHWQNEITVDRFISNSTNDMDIEVIDNYSQQINGSSILPQFSLSVEVL